MRGEHRFAGTDKQRGGISPCFGMSVQKELEAVQKGTRIAPLVETPNVDDGKFVVRNRPARVEIVGIVAVENWIELLPDQRRVLVAVTFGFPGRIRDDNVGRPVNAQFQFLLEALLPAELLDIIEVLVLGPRRAEIS